MKSRHIFSMLFGVVFCQPLFAGISVAGIDSAKSDYLGSVKKLTDSYSKKQVKKELLDGVLEQANENAAKLDVVSAKEKEQSQANKMLGGLTMAATGIGGMQLAQGLAEKKADEEASADMAAYLKTITCGISGGARNLKYNDNGTLPPETREIADSRLQYITIAKKMKSAKENLGMQPGIESDLLIDTSKGLYDNAGTDTNGIVHHFDTATERQASGDGKNRAMIGGAVGGLGAIGGVVGNSVINNNSGDKSSGGSSGGGLGGILGSVGGSGGLSGVLGSVGGSGITDKLGSVLGGK
jgi:uncharacterized lipoprotein YehR (DUF1307 family)